MSPRCTRCAAAPAACPPAVGGVGRWASEPHTFAARRGDAEGQCSKPRKAGRQAHQIFVELGQAGLACVARAQRTCERRMCTSAVPPWPPQALRRGRPPWLLMIMKHLIIIASLNKARCSANAALRRAGCSRAAPDAVSSTGLTARADKHRQAAAAVNVGRVRRAKRGRQDSVLRQRGCVGHTGRPFAGTQAPSQWRRSSPACRR